MSAPSLSPRGDDPSRAVGIAWKALVFGAAPVLLVAWCNWPLDPDAWRTFSRGATDAELRRNLPSDDGSREHVERWHRYLRALELERGCFSTQLTSCDRWFEDGYLEMSTDAVAEKASLEKRREAVSTLLDGGWSAEASACLARLRD